MQRKLLPVILLGLILLGAAAALADGDFYSAGPWGTRITSLPYTISAPGSYYLGSNLSYAGGDGITVNSDDVTLDLMGFTITGTGNVNNGIRMNGRNNVEIRNGTLSGWFCGIRDNSSGVGHRVTNVRAEGNINGICLMGSGHLIQGCRATAAGTAGYGLLIGSQGTISGCQTSNFSVYGIYIFEYGTISGNVVIGPGNVGSDGGIFAGAASLVMGNEVTNAGTGIYCNEAASVIGNTVSTSAGQIGIRVSTQPTVLDQNTSLGGGTHYQGITFGVTKTRNNAG